MTFEVEFQPIGKRLGVEPGNTILDAAQQAGVGVSAICGGGGSCDACRVILTDQAHVTEPTTLETKALHADQLKAGLRLACQTEIRGPVRIEIPPESMTAAQRTQVEGEEVGFTFEPLVEVRELTLSKAQSSDLKADFERLSESFVGEGGQPLECRRLDLLKQIPEILRGNQWRIQIGVRGQELVWVSVPGTPVLGMAVDIGTTKVAGYLVDMADGRTLAMKGIMNPQIAYGEDVLARITHCMMNEDGRDILQRCIIQALGDLARDLCAAAQADAGAGGALYEPAHIVESVMVGNTAMHHLLLGLPVEQLGLAPYVAALSSPLDVKAHELALPFSPGANVHLLANIAGFVGADHLSMLLATDTHKKSGVVISLDIGTNTEITLSANGRMTACSTASGPAFEGAHIRDGMRAAEGAIERIQIIDNEVVFQTIGHSAPVGICGSGILDAIAQLRMCGAMDEKGGLDEGHSLIRRGEKLAEALLAEAGISGHDRDIVLTRGDINEIQMAKGAMRAGIELLLRAAGVSAHDVEEVIIAGAFGTYISVESAVAIGMFPDIPLDRFRQVGNAAGIGAKQALLSRTRRGEAADLGQRVEYLELTVSQDFQEEFLKGMYL